MIKKKGGYQANVLNIDPLPSTPLRRLLIVSNDSLSRYLSETDDDAFSQPATPTLVSALMQLTWDQ